MYRIEFNFADNWAVIATDIVSIDAANWAIASWKQANRCTSDRCFRIRQADGSEL